MPTRSKILLAVILVLASVLGILVTVIPGSGDASAAARASLTRQLNICGSGQTSIKCSAGALDLAATVIPAPLAMKALIELVAGNGSLATSCHEVGHIFGTVSYKKLGTEAWGPGLQDCGYGYYHGVLEGMAQSGKLSDFRKFALSMCTEGEQRDSRRCIHGVGHAASIAFTSLDDATNLCEQFSDHDFMITCVEGAAMIWSGDNPNETPGNIIQQCRAISDDVQEQQYCLTGVIEYMKITPQRLDELKKACVGLGEDPLAGYCWRGLGWLLADTFIWAKDSARAATIKDTAGYCAGTGLEICYQQFGNQILIRYMSVSESNGYCDLLGNGSQFCRAGVKNSAESFMNDPSLRP